MKLLRQDSHTRNRYSRTKNINIKIKRDVFNLCFIIGQREYNRYFLKDVSNTFEYCYLIWELCSLFSNSLQNLQQTKNHGSMTIDKECLFIY